MYKFVLMFLVPVFVLSLESKAQQARVVFYNVENLFDTEDDTLTVDEEFLPDGEKHWTYERFWTKVVRIYQVMTAIGEGEMPGIIGLCEIENRKVLERIVYDTPLSQLNYRIIHQDSQDARGIDVALLYRPDIFMPDSADWIPVVLPDGTQTREILHVRGKLFHDHIIHIYVNHWPSRYGGAVSSQTRRMEAAKALRKSVESVLLSETDPNIVIMGDFNDEPGDESMKWLCSLKGSEGQTGRQVLINLSAEKIVANSYGTIKHQGAWSIFDQVIISHALAIGSNGLISVSKAAEIFDARFLLEVDETYTGFKPFRTYIGPGYHGGFSDHLPVSVLIGISE